MKPVPKTRSKRGSGGYILITLILFVALLAIAAAAILPQLIFEIKRDREEELVHRGTQYSRAIKRFVKKSGNYPVRLEQLDNTNQIRFLRKRYKDPVTGKEFKLLHQSDVPTLAAGLALAGAAGGAGAGQQGQQQLAGLAAQALAAQGAQGGVQGATSPGASLFGDQQSAQQNGTQPSSSEGGLFGTPTNTPGTPGGVTNGDQTGQAPGNGTTGGNASGSSSSSTSNSTSQPSAQVFGSGGPIVGVSSTSKDKTIRVYNKKDHYNQWQFVYDPSADRGGLITTPYQTPLQTSTPILNGQPGANGVPGTSGAGGNSGVLGGPGGSSQGNPVNTPTQQLLTPNDTPLQQ